jgi:hypothetical protein
LIEYLYSTTAVSQEEIKKKQKERNKRKNKRRNKDKIKILIAEE